MHNCTSLTVLTKHWFDFGFDIIDLPGDEVVGWLGEFGVMAQIIPVHPLVFN